MVQDPQAAETLALQALAWLIGNDALREVFQGSTGLSQNDLRTRAGDPDLLAAVLDFLLMDDAWVIAFCDTQGVAYDRLMQARGALPGGAQIHWT